MPTAPNNPHRKKRLESIDFLRGIAVMLVLFTHHQSSTGIMKHGWIGVDLFFVLSGFLVSGLLFKEHKKHGNIKPGRFLIRRGFKIYPLFYTSILITLLLYFVFPSVHNFGSLNAKGWAAAVGPELVFVQNYLPGIWPHHWSLAVEEHFYLIIALAFPFIVKRIVPVAVVVLAGSLLLRMNDPDNLVASHLRMDSLFFGVLIAYGHHECDLRGWYARNKYYVFPLLLLPMVLLVGTPHWIAYTLLYISFGAYLIVFLYEDIGRGLVSRIGVYSYGIYLFHMYLVRYAELPFLVYFVGAILLGAGMSKIVEIPFLKIRDKYVPPRDPSPKTEKQPAAALELSPESA